MQIGIAGTGKMGSAIAKRLLAGGHHVTVWNRTRARAQPLLDAGATWADTPAAMASQVDTAITMVSDDAALEAVHFGPGGFMQGPRDGRLFIDMSTVAPDTQRSVGQRVQAAGARYLECPVGGSVGPASQGKLLGFIGGAGEDVERARPLLEQLCRRLEHVGGFGAGATMKLAINLPLLVYWQTLSEALSLLQPLGLDPARVVDILSDTSGGPNMLKVRGPMIAQALSGQSTGEVSVDVATMRKDVRAMLAQGEAAHYRLPITSQLLQTLEKAGRAGMDGADCTQVPVWWLKGAGKE